MKLPVFYNSLNFQERREVREEYIRLQKGKCYCCGELLNGEPSSFMLNMKINKNMYPANFFKFPVHLHHNHRTGLTLGAVHCYCNAVLWQYYGE